ncbi:putative iron(III) dicitrate ABC transporter, ATP-binding protein FecE [Selenomonas sp. oral taxon 892 str. F0426]|uniref:ABC transporter ATP-binding protein n=1 Tax=Selenomonas sp. oral taxon 892 TaxID=1321785 RepID=UPI0003AD2ACB|nr:ABC transporter ATP-binding protein [Selenomonas sp. oral taxon 892]ERJ89431.1 putative iron(III) dicitrate ABC transporter, ATP-binding protein FecE [Selenomonas sp. oral taxon 892 str. F0426]
MIRAETIYAGYNGQVILENVSFTVGTGEIVGLIGPNGAGKSTLLKTLRGILPLLSGSAALMGVDIETLPAKDFARRVAYLQQHVEMTFAYTARDVVLSGRYPYLSWWSQEKAEDLAIAEACMAYTGVSELADKPLHAMSGGQRQRVLLAKVLAQQTPVLFLDEPATGLDLIYQEEIFRFCRELAAAGKTVLLVAHELSLAARFCSRLLLIAHGSLLADGAPQAVLTDELLTKAYGAPVRVVENPLTRHAEIYTEASDGRENAHLLSVILERSERGETVV